MIKPQSSYLSNQHDDIYHIYQQYEPSQHQDLYDLLLHQPTNNKKPSIIYDYTPTNIITYSTIEPYDELLLLPDHASHQSSQTTIISIRKCTCSKTKCQKNYCQCFKQGLACTSQCQCINCCNKEKLFLEKWKYNGQGCHCMKSKCQKNYCECHLNGRRCGDSCKCVDCQNIYLPQDCLELSVSQRPSKRHKINEKI